MTAIRAGLPLGWRVALGAGGVLAVLGLWAWRSAVGGADAAVLVPTPAATWDAFVAMVREGVFVRDLLASTQRVAIGYGVSVLVGVLLGVAIGSFAAVEAFFEAQIGFVRYIPASALTPLFLLWLGLGESPKVWLIVLGTVFYNVLMVADVARGVPRALLDAAFTLGAGRLSVLRRVILPYATPGILDVARINLAAGWLMLVVAEILAAKEGLAFRINLATRFRAVDRMFALLIVFGLVGLASDLTLRWLRNRVAPWARS